MSLPKERFRHGRPQRINEKLHACGLRGKSGDCFESYLTNRKQFCSLNGLHSKAREVTCGIPQGSCLGPLLFIIYLNDLQECLQSSRASIYADDTSLTIASGNPARLVDDAQASSERKSPQVGYMMILAALFGLLGGVGMAFLLDALMMFSDK